MLSGPFEDVEDVVDARLEGAGAADVAVQGTQLSLRSDGVRGGARADLRRAWCAVSRDYLHDPERLRIAGFINAVRWLGAENPRISLAIYDLESLEVLQKPEYRAVSPEQFSPWAQRMLVRKCVRICRFKAGFKSSYPARCSHP